MKKKFVTKLIFSLFGSLTFQGQSWEDIFVSRCAQFSIKIIYLNSLSSSRAWVLQRGFKKLFSEKMATILVEKLENFCNLLSLHSTQYQRRDWLNWWIVFCCSPETQPRRGKMICARCLLTNTPIGSMLSPYFGTPRLVPRSQMFVYREIQFVSRRKNRLENLPSRKTLFRSSRSKWERFFVTWIL